MQAGDFDSLQTGEGFCRERLGIESVEALDGLCTCLFFRRIIPSPTVAKVTETTDSSEN